MIDTGRTATVLIILDSNSHVYSKFLFISPGFCSI